MGILTHLTNEQITFFDAGFRAAICAIDEAAQTKVPEIFYPKIAELLACLHCEDFRE